MKKILFLIGILATTTLQARQSSYLYFADKNGLMDSLEVAIDLTDEERASIPEWSYDETVTAIKRINVNVDMKDKELEVSVETNSV